MNRCLFSIVCIYIYIDCFPFEFPQAQIYFFCEAALKGTLYVDDSKTLSESRNGLPALTTPAPLADSAGSEIASKTVEMSVPSSCLIVEGRGFDFIWPKSIT